MSNETEHLEYSPTHPPAFLDKLTPPPVSKAPLECPGAGSNGWDCPPENGCENCFSCKICTQCTCPKAPHKEKQNERKARETKDKREATLLRMREYSATRRAESASASQRELEKNRKKEKRANE